MATDSNCDFKPQEISFNLDVKAESLKASARAFVTWIDCARAGGVDVTRFLAHEVLAKQILRLEVDQIRYQGVRAVKIQDTDLPPQLQKILVLELVIFLGDLEKKTEAGLMKIAGVKYSRINAINACLKSYGLTPLSPE